MKPARTPKAKATLNALVLQAEADEAVRETLAMSDEQIERELVAAGFDLEAERRVAATMREGFEGVARQRSAASVEAIAEASVRRRVRNRRAWVAVLAIAAAILLGVGGLRALSRPQPIAVRHLPLPTFPQPPASGQPLDERGEARPNVVEVRGTSATNRKATPER